VGSDDKRLPRVDDHLRSSLSEPVSLSTLARVAGISRFHLLRLFKTRYGEAPLKRLTRFRMDEARRLLLRSNLPVTETTILRILPQRFDDM
jgi:AraC family transcriptional regulator